MKSVHCQFSGGKHAGRFLFLANTLHGLCRNEIIKKAVPHIETAFFKALPEIIYCFINLPAACVFA
jgi:hypothetical protein